MRVSHTDQPVAGGVKHHVDTETLRFGIFGGTFDPFHIGHMHLLDCVLERVSLEVIHVIPALVPPLKPQPVASAAHRINMVKCAIDGRERLVCDDREIRREGTSYTVLTLMSLNQEYLARADHKARAVLIIGHDVFAQLHRWHRWREIPGLSDLLVINRPDLSGNDGAREIDPAIEECLKNTRVDHLDIPPRDISATEIRRRLGMGEDVTGMLPDTVLSYIKAHSLYD
ncbi:MAG: putative nicotinate-nucleotide adenylyltransferase [marine bacterium B5-7]|nr:MAG: putative nicotinate-nucleotide adenylyltransferase [marine bacterium B5-7]